MKQYDVVVFSDINLSIYRRVSAVQGFQGMFPLSSAKITPLIPHKLDVSTHFLKWPGLIKWWTFFQSGSEQGVFLTDSHEVVFSFLLIIVYIVFIEN